MAGPRPLRFGVLAAPARDAPAWRRTARRAEELGYSALLVPDHLGQQWGPLVSLAIAAEQTDRIALGTLMLAVDLRCPVVLFKELATLGQFAPGRLEIGLGAGWFAGDFTASGVALAPPATRIERLDEAAQILKGLWAHKRLSFRGRHYQVAEASGEPRPPDPDAVRWVLGGGGRRVLEVAARHADIVSLSARMSSGAKDSSFGASATAGQFDRRAGWLRHFAGDRLAGIEVQCLVFAAAVVADRDRYAARVLSPMFGLPPELALDSPLALAGTVGQICDQLLARRERFGISYWVVGGAQMEQFAAVVSKMSGS
jgi:probable F420-dependent oxidoreductase